MTRRSGILRAIAAPAVGLAATGAVWLLWLAGAFDVLELLALDGRFSLAGNAEPNAALLRIDIDDASLERFGRWPWPRKQLAGVIEVLLDCNARLVAPDVILPEPQPVRYESPSAEVYAADAELLGTLRPRPVFDDAALAAVIANAEGRVIFPLFIRDQAPAADRFNAMLATRPALSLAAIEAGADGRDDEPLASAYLRARALLAVQRLGLDPDTYLPAWVHRGTVVPPVATVAEVLPATGFVSFSRDTDHVLRHVPVLMAGPRRTYLQYALLLASEHWSDAHGPLAEVHADGRSLTLRFADGFSRTVPLDDRGRLLVNWVRPGRLGGQRIAIGPAAACWQLRQRLAELQRQRVARWHGLAELAYNPDRASIETLQNRHRFFQIAYAVDRLDERIMVQRREALADALFDPAAAEGVDPNLLARQRAAEAELARTAEAMVAALSDPDERAFLLGGRDDAAAAESAIVAHIEALGEIPAIEAELRATLRQRLAELKPRVAGRICLIGANATGAADFVPTPIANRAAGVEVHENVFYTLVNGAYIRRAVPWLNAAVLLAAGALASWLTGRLNPTAAAPAVLVACGAYVLVNIGVWFALLNWWVGLVAPLAAMATAFVAVTAWRQLTEQRERRRLRGLFAHALSPALVDQLVEDPSLAELGGQRRRVTCFFSDVAKFTPLAERLGEQETVRLLNHYFDHMTEVIQNRQGGYLNKFLGDGIFALFGAPVAQSDHAGRAVRAALQCQAEVRKLNEELRSASAGDAPTVLTRVGVATGEVMVGNCGSSQRMDYTAIGDTVNLASRLESANKFFGTGILIEQGTWAEADDGTLLARPMGRLRVVGRRAAVAIYQPLGERAAATAETLDRLERFTRALEAFAAGQFAAAGQAFAELAAAGDAPAAAYRDVCADLAADPPGPQWDGALELSEK